MQVGSRVDGLPWARVLTLRARSPGGTRAGFPRHAGGKENLSGTQAEFGRITWKQREDFEVPLKSPRWFLPKFQEQSREAGSGWEAGTLPHTFPSSSHASSSTLGKSPNSPSLSHSPVKWGRCRQPPRQPRRYSDTDVQPWARAGRGHWTQKRACLASGHQNDAARYPGVLFNCEFCRSVLLVPLRLHLRTRCGTCRYRQGVSDCGQVSHEPRAVACAGSPESLVIQT